MPSDPASIPTAKNNTNEGIPIFPEVLLAIILTNSKIETRRIIFSLVISIGTNKKTDIKKILNGEK
jgi:hypothetical protein